MNIDSLPDLITLKELANILRVTTLTIKRWEKKGKVTAVHINSRGDRRYKRAEVLRLIEGR